GVRQGDPLSPLLFCIAEDVLSRSISKLVLDGKLDLIKGTRHNMVPSHTFYADDLMIFCKGKLAGLTELKALFTNYAVQSGQTIKTAKSTIYSGKPKACWLQPIADKIQSKLSTWKASLLSMAGRVQLVRAVIQSMLIYSISLYSWPSSLINHIEKCVKNFIWSGDIEKRKLVTVAWKKLCRPFAQGGLNL
ncbi:RNA-directed DNA polymerase (Reverse transcriptase), partial [Trifolium medium]|nr:RNA-directed DNA polymerase (Reverse transcriptase) [Trifolium medium]